MPTYFLCLSCAVLEHCHIQEIHHLSIEQDYKPKKTRCFKHHFPVALYKKVVNRDI